MTVRSNIVADLFSRFPVLAWGVVTAVLLMLFLCGLSTNPPGFYMDESCMAYNGYLVAQTGVSEAGQSFPVFFQCYTEGYIQWMNSELIYMLAGLYTIVPPSVLSARIFSATLVFIATLLLGLLAYRLSGRRTVGVIVALTAMATPWFFEISRLVQETSVLVLAIVLFLFLLHRTFRRDDWEWGAAILLAVSLGFITYAYAAGRVLAPGFAFGLLIFVVNRRVLVGVLKTWAVYFLTLLPLIAVYFTNRNAITGRFHEVSYMTPDRSWLSVVGEFIINFVQDLSPIFLLFEGDKLFRHHVPGMGEIFVATYVLVLAGLGIFAARNWRDPWWRFVLYGTLVSIVPGALTVSRHHALRLIALPVFLTLLTVPALQWLTGGNAADGSERGGIGKRIASIIPREVAATLADSLARSVMLAVVLALTFVQFLFFQMQFREIGPSRIHDFDGTYHRVLTEALRQELRPIYLEDGYWGPAYIHAYWYAATDGIDPANFVHLRVGEVPPPGSVVLSSNLECQNCQRILQEGACLLYKTRGAQTVSPDGQPIESGPAPNFGEPVVLKSAAEGDGGFLQPRGLAVDQDGNIYVSDTGNARVVKLDRQGKPVISFGTKGTEAGQMMEPNGVAVDAVGNIYVVDSLNFKLMKFDKTGGFLKEWSGAAFEAYGPRDIAIGPDNRIYVLDQGNSRVVIFDPARESSVTWGRAGAGPGQFNNAVGLGIGNDMVFVADSSNNRIQVFDLDGNYLREWPVPAWESFLYHYPDVVYDDSSKCVFVSNGRSSEVLAYDMNGDLKEDLSPGGDASFDNPSSLAIAVGKDPRSLVVLNTRNGTVTKLPMETKLSK